MGDVHPPPQGIREKIMTFQYSRRNIAQRSANRPEAGSKLVRRLVQAKDDPAKERLRMWLSAIEDERLLGFGLTPEDVAVLRGHATLLELMRPGE